MHDQGALDPRLVLSFDLLWDSLASRRPYLSNILSNDSMNDPEKQFSTSIGPKASRKRDENHERVLGTHCMAG